MNKFSYSTLELSKMVELPHLSFSNELSTNIKGVGISGASGFLGLNIINSLTKDKKISKIKCFIRSKETFNSRKKLFGLNFEENKLEFFYDFNKESTKELDVFIHSAAQIHNLKNLSRLFNDNVALTEKIVKQVACPIVHIGTLSIYASSNITGSHSPIAATPLDQHVLYGGYAQSKWLAEYIVSKRRDSKIIRLGLLTPSTENPILQKDEFFSLFLKLIKTFPYYPETYENAWVDISPINIVVESILQNIKCSEKYAHIANKNGTSIQDFINILKLKPIGYQEWNNYVQTLKTTERILLSYAYFKTQALKLYPSYLNIDLFQTTRHNWNGSIQIDDLSLYLKNIYEKI